jgi:hypothetical protein
MPGKISTDSDGIDAAPASVDFFDKALAFVVDNPANYYLVINQDYTAQTEKTAMATGITLTIVGLGSERTITSNTGNGRIFVINNGAQLYLENNITLKGKATATTNLIYINDGSLNMNDGSKITGHTTTLGVILVTGSTSSFVMNGGEISGNRSTSTDAGIGIVYIANGGIFTMNGGTVTGNTVAGGACINVYDHASNLPTFNMNGGTITGNTNTNTGLYPGGVFIQAVRAYSLSFTRAGGSITGNTGNAGDVLKTGGTNSGNDTFIFQEGNGVIGTLTVQPHTALLNTTAAQIRIGGNWTGSVQVLNLYANQTGSANVYTQYNNRKPLVSGYGTYTLTSADIDNFKQVNFMRADFQTQNIAVTSYVLARSGANIGSIY